MFLTGYPRGQRLSMMRTYFLTGFSFDLEKSRSE
jgi:hypothetical protein